MVDPNVSQTITAITSLLFVIGGGELFTTGTEWVSERLGLSEKATGSVFAALATSLPETLIPVLAILRGSGASVGIGAILGGPITLTTLAVFLIGVTASASIARGARDPSLTINARQTKRDIRAFLVGFSIAFLVTFLHGRLVPIVASFVLVGLYLSHLYQISRDTEVVETSEPEPLELGKGMDRYGSVILGAESDRNYATDPPTSLVTIQVVVAVVLLLVGSHLLVEAIEWAAETVVPVPTIIIALLVAPVVSNLPENVDGIIWVRRGRDSIAVEQLTGALAFQGTVGVSIGVLFTPWELTPVWGTVDFLVTVAAVIALISSGALYSLLATETEQEVSPAVFSGFGLFYLLFIGLLGYYLAAGLL